MRSSFFLGSTALTAITLLCTPAWAGRPLTTEDAGVLERKACEVEAAHDRERVGSTRSRESSLQLACGVGGATQLSIAAASGNDGGSGSRALILGGKTRIAGGDDGPQGAWTLAYGMSARKAASTGSRTDTAALNLVHSRKVFGDNTLHLNVGHARDVQARVASTSYGVGYEQGGFGALVPVAEIQGNDRGAPWWALGLRADLLNDKLVLGTAYGRQMQSGRPSRWTLSAKLAF